MFTKVETVTPISDSRLRVLFVNGVSKIYDIKVLANQFPLFRTLLNNPKIFSNVKVDVGGYGISWNDEIDLSCDELWENGI